MISLITDFSLIIAESSAAGNIPTGLIFLICIVAFILSTIIFGICTYKTKLKQLRKKNSENSENTSEKQGG
ncbi:MAG: hypothetical protein IKK66_06395 [Ruminococcus sp.]|nr:hypothetical protein [Ruminococcus sp.]